MTFLLKQLLLTSWFLILGFFWGYKLNSTLFDHSCIFAVVLTNILVSCWCTASSWLLHGEVCMYVCVCVYIYIYIWQTQTLNFPFYRDSIGSFMAKVLTKFLSFILRKLWIKLFTSHQSSLKVSPDLILLFFLVHYDSRFLLHSTITLLWSMDILVCCLYILDTMLLMFSLSWRERNF